MQPLGSVVAGDVRHAEILSPARRAGIRGDQAFT